MRPVPTIRREVRVRPATDQESGVIALNSSASNEMDDLNAVALAKAGHRPQGARHDSEVSLHGDLARVQAELGDQADEVARRLE